MGSRSRSKPSRLGEKLLQIRRAVDGGLSQKQMAERLDVEGINKSYVSRWEANLLEPDLNTLLRYGELANVYLDALANDNIDLPAHIPGASKTAGILRVEKRGKRTTNRADG